MLEWDPTGKAGPKKPLPDMVTILEPKETEEPSHYAANLVAAHNVAPAVDITA